MKPNTTDCVSMNIAKATQNNNIYPPKNKQQKKSGMKLCEV